MNINNTSKIILEPALTGISKNTAKNIIEEWQESENKFQLLSANIEEHEELELINQINECIKGEGGEISRHGKILHVAMTYLNLSDKGKKKFLNILSEKFNVDIDNLETKIKNFKNAKSNKEIIDAEITLSETLIPPRVLFLQQLITLPNGYIFLKDMREDLLSIKKEFPLLKKLDREIKNMLITYFDVNLLDLKEISWNSPAIMLERIAGYEAVHKINTWQELKHRLSSNYKIYGFFHYRMPNDPLIFVEVAFTKGIARNIQQIIDVNFEKEKHSQIEADTAIFYSISATQKGLRGISFGNFLIKRVAKLISKEFPNIKKFSTLSPIPTYKKWLQKMLVEKDNVLLKDIEIEKIKKFNNKKDVSDIISDIINQKDWHKNEVYTNILKQPLMRLCVHYLTTVKAKFRNSACDPVANFHLTNGAKILHINWLGDISENGFSQSLGIMVNYEYRTDMIAKNHEDYLTKGYIHISSDVKSWLE